MPDSSIRPGAVAIATQNGLRRFRCISYAIAPSFMDLPTADGLEPFIHVVVNRAGNPPTAPRCGARTQGGSSCLSPAIRGKRRCRLHGGLSTGPTTLAGLERGRPSRWKHGGYAVGARQRATAWALKRVEKMRAEWGERGRTAQAIIKVPRRQTRVRLVFEDPTVAYLAYLTQLAKEVRALRRRRARQARRSVRPSE